MQVVVNLLRKHQLWTDLLFYQQLQQVGDIIKYRLDAGRFFCRLYKSLHFRLDIKGAIT